MKMRSINSLGFLDTTDHLILARRPNSVLILHKKRIYQDNFTVFANHRVKNERKRKDRQIFDLTREVKKLWNIVIYKALCFDVAQGRMNGAPNETRAHSCRFASQDC